MTAFRTGAEVVWPNHNGSRPEPTALYFGEPADQIGRIVSATTSDVTRPSGKAVAGQLFLRAFLGAFMAGVGAGVGFGMAWVVGQMAPKTEDVTMYGVVLFGALGFVAGLLLYNRKTHSTYLGTEGLARVTRGRNGVSSELMRWDDAATLQFNQTRHYTNGVYTGTNYNYTWRDASGAKRMVIGGAFRQKESEKAPAANPVHFAHAAESAWTAWKIQGMADELAANGMIVFGVTKKNWIGVGQGFIELHWKDTVERLTPADIDAIELNSGWMTIKRVGARKGLFSSDGVFRFNVNGMSNFRYFLATLHALLGYRF